MKPLARSRHALFRELQARGALAYERTIIPLAEKLLRFPQYKHYRTVNALREAIGDEGVFSADVAALVATQALAREQAARLKREENRRKKAEQKIKNKLKAQKKKAWRGRYMWAAEPAGPSRPGEAAVLFGLPQGDN